MKVAVLDDCHLAYWVAVAENLTPFVVGKFCATVEATAGSTPLAKNAKSMGHSYAPHLSWAQGGPLVEKYAVTLYPYLDGLGWYAHACNGRGTRMEGQSPLVAAMRSIVATKYGKDVSDSDVRTYLTQAGSLKEALQI
jgi:hypothetical protein